MSSPRVLTRPRKIATGVATAAVGASFALLTLTACGGEQDVTDTATSSAAVAPASPNASAPVVAGRKPATTPATSRTTTSSGATASETGGPGTQCGTVPGPDGALTVTILAGDVSCETADEIGVEYGPKIATGTQHEVSGWTCGPSQLRGVLSACQKGKSVIGFAP